MAKDLTDAEKEKAVALKSATGTAISTAVNAEALIAQGLAQGVTVETMERLLAMRKELKAEAAREAFFTALSKLQAEMPVIEKTKKVFEKGSTTRVRYCYAPLDSIVEQTKTVLQKNGFSYTIKVLQTEKTVEVICEAHHEAGHTEATGFSVPLGSAQYMSMAQETGSANTFAKRYAFCNAFGIMTGDEDTDAIQPETPPATANAPAPKSTPVAAPKSAPAAPPAAKTGTAEPAIDDDTDNMRKKELMLYVHKYVFEPKPDADKKTKDEYYAKAKVKLGGWAKTAGFTFTLFKDLTGKNLNDILIIARAESAGI